MHQRFGEEFESVTLITVIEDQEKVWPDIVDIRSHQKLALED